MRLPKRLNSLLTSFFQSEIDRLVAEGRKEKTSEVVPRDKGGKASFISDEDVDKFLRWLPAGFVLDGFSEDGTEVYFSIHNNRMDLYLKKAKLSKCKCGAEGCATVDVTLYSPVDSVHIAFSQPLVELIYNPLVAQTYFELLKRNVDASRFFGMLATAPEGLKIIEALAGDESSDEDSEIREARVKLEQLYKQRPGNPELN